MEIMEIRDAVERFRGESGTSTIFGEPHQTSDGSTIITVSRLHRRWRRDPIPVPVGVFSIHEGEPSWSPAVDHTRAALMGGVHRVGGRSDRNSGRSTSSALA